MERQIPGIDQGDRVRPFTHFARLVTADSSNIPATGLGLYLSREIARMHRGEILVENERLVGSTFTLVLPLAGVG